MKAQYELQVSVFFSLVNAASGGESRSTTHCACFEQCFH